MIRQVEKRPRETVLGAALAEAVAALQQQLRREGHPLHTGLRHVPFDFKKESKRKGVDVLQTVERIAARMVEMTGSWLKMASTLFDDTTPSARLVPPGARAAPTHPRAQPGQLGSLRWPLLARLSLLRR